TSPKSAPVIQIDCNSLFMIYLLCDIPGASQDSLRWLCISACSPGSHSHFVSRLCRRKFSPKTASPVQRKWRAWKWKPEGRCANLCATTARSKLQRGFHAAVLATGTHASAQGLERRG